MLPGLSISALPTYTTQNLEHTTFAIMKFNLLTILIFALLLAPFMAASPINTTFSNTSASVLAARDDSWDFAWNFKDANGG